jgi:predicted NBD/HSP70 family sugar kinase
MAGEISHVPVIKNGRECACGQNGCLETYLYGQGLIRRYEQETGAQLEEPEELFCRMADQDPYAKSLMNEGVEALTTVLSLAANMADLDLIVIGGLWGRLGDSFLSSIEIGCNEIIERTGLGKTLAVRGSALCENSDILGAVATVINRWFTPQI